MESLQLPQPRTALPWLGALFGLGAAIGSGVLLAELLMSPPLGELAKLALYFGLAGGSTLGAAWLMLAASMTPPAPRPAPAPAPTAP